jgi:hypothetical protein
MSSRKREKGGTKERENDANEKRVDGVRRQGF